MLLEDVDVDPLSGQLRSTFDPDKRAFECRPDVEVGHCVALLPGGLLGIADARDRARVPALGIATERLSATHCAIQVSGVVRGLSGLTALRAHFVGLGGALVRAKPSPNPGGRVYLQQMGVARSETEFVLRPWQFLIRRTQ